MRDAKEAVVILCKCGENHKTYGIRTEKQGMNNWLCTWTFPIKEAAAAREGYDKTTVRGNIAFSDDFPGCPYCGGHNWVVCSCGHLNCRIVKDGTFTCEWCGLKGSITDYGGEAITAGMDL